MPERLGPDGRWKVNVILRKATTTTVVHAAVQRSELLDSVHDMIDVTPFGTKWRNFLPGRRHYLHRLELRAELQQPIPAPGPNLHVRVDHSSPQGLACFHCEVVAVSGCHGDVQIAVHAYCGDAAVFM